MKTVLTGATIYSEQGMLKNAAIVIQDSKIQSIIDAKKIAAETVLSFPASYHIVPGFIDLHVHGANGSDVMDATTEALTTISHALAAEGTTAFLATTMTATPQKIEKALHQAQKFMEEQASRSGAKMLGVHLEGPFISPQKIGAQSSEPILPLNVATLQQWQKKSGDCIKLVTLAPELPNSFEFIQFLKENNIVASIGHSNATYKETLAAIDAGCSHVTHLFNAMRGIHQREPGVVTAALLSNKVSAELIADGLHLHPAIIQLILATKSKEKIVLVTDAMRAKCMGDGVYDLGGQAVHVKSGIASLSDGTLAGSTLKMSSAIRNMLEFTDCTLEEVIRFASENPAKVLAIFDQKGSLLPGKDADMVVLDEAFNVVLTLSMGEVVYEGMALPSVLL